MTTHPHTVRYGYFPDLKGDPVVLFVGDQVALENFAAFLAALSISQEQGQEVYDKKPLFAPEHATRLKVQRTSSPGGMRRFTSTAGETRLEWSLSNAIAQRFAYLTQAVAAADYPCHHYLDAGETDEITVIVSKDEYDDSVFPTPGADAA